MTDVFEVAKPKEAAPLAPKVKPAPKPRQPPAQDVVAREDTVPVKKTRRKRTPRPVDDIDEHMLFMSMYTELKAMAKAPRVRLLNSLLKVLG